MRETERRQVMLDHGERLAKVETICTAMYNELHNGLGKLPERVGVLEALMRAGLAVALLVLSSVMALLVKVIGG